MKKFYLLTVVTLLCCIGCVNEPYDEQMGAQLPQDVVLTVAVQSPSRVVLGDKDANGGYSATWSAGDKISVNGYISEEAVISEENGGVAQFEIKNAVLNYPYNVLYPASANSVVNFAAEQNYVEGSFESGTTPMYASVADVNKGINLKHLGAVLKFNFKGAESGVVLKSMTIESGNGAIAGEFAIDFATGKVTPSSSATSTIELNFGDGLALSVEEAKSFFVALPSGDFGLCSATLCTTDNREMGVRFNTSGSSALRAGVVREYGAVSFKEGMQYTLTPYGCEEDELIVDNNAYVAAPTTVDGEWLVINTPQELMWLCANTPVVEGKQYNKIRIGEDIDMGIYSALRLESMKISDGTEIDGNNKTITGVNLNEEASSLFGDKKILNIHDLTLANCSVNTAIETGAAILVGKADEGLTVNNVTLNNCSVVAPRKIGLVAGALHTGTFSISGVTANGGVVETSYVSGKSGLAGGLVGCFAKNGDGATTSTATFTNCTTSATVKSYMESNNYFYGKMVGQLGGYNGDEKLYFANCDAKNATLVPLYDQGNKYAEKAILTYCEACRADFCEKMLTSATDNLLGGERYCRGEVYVDGERFYAEWDGIRSVSMLTESVDGITRYLVQSPYDLATAQAAKYSTTKALVFKSDVDMGKHLFKPIEYVINLDGENHSLYNLKVDVVHKASSNYGAGFIVYANNATTHKDLTFVGADVNCSHDSSLPSPAYGVTEDKGEGNAYAGVLVSRSWRTAIKDDAGNTTGYTNYNVSNIHVRDSKVRGVCKVGGLIGACRGQVYMDNCSVDNSTIENYDPKVANYYTMKKSISASFMGDYIVEGLQWWYTAGECGGLIGFLEAHYAEITNCSVTNSRINCTGQPNKEVVANVWKSSSFTEGAYASGKSITMSATTTIAGRHVNQFIGDVRSRRTETQANNGTGEYTNKILNYTVSGNSYNGVPADGANEYNHNYATDKYCEVVGCAYYTGVDLTILIVSTHVSECAGTLTFSPKGGSEVTLTEAVGKGNNMDWFGGDGQTRSGSSYYPEAPQN